MHKKLQIKKVYLCGHHSQPQSKLPSSSDEAGQTKPFALLVLAITLPFPRRKITLVILLYVIFLVIHSWLIYSFPHGITRWTWEVILPNLPSPYTYYIVT